MDAAGLLLPLPIIVAVVAVTLIASFVKGAVGFAMPMIMMSGLASVMPAERALATLIIPTLMANLWQTLRGGLPQARQVVREFWRYLLVVLVFIALAAQLVTSLPPGVMYLVIGIPIIVFSLVQIAGWKPRIPPHGRWLADVGIGLLAGFMGGLSGVWGPPTVLYLLAIEAPKKDAISVQGVVYGAGSLVLMLAHIRSGVLSAETAPLGAALLVPMIAGLWVGQMVQDRLDQQKFRRAMLFVLIIAGLNLIRRGLGDLG
ncbi:sulfite exporter TauE/SafE family protein [Meridianimarinicoccus aquatilis]|uniref:Probable membrane transporter protein n=1 Tax=Meridianimarinicoccus aquatilis TaxID=2552766 RepID=A0A4V3BCE9_9RHOB|nr:sulfite exporter TauE/SafE family protein [Fluviibacterium aquatile]TDL90629.1 sulfite exporter TauE/SafE family protein [Fluviibacterium aquatile]